MRINGEYSISLDVLYGAPQDSVLGPGMFSVFVRNQPKVFEKCNFRLSAFAVDSNGRKSLAISL